MISCPCILYVSHSGNLLEAILCQIQLHIFAYVERPPPLEFDHVTAFFVFSCVFFLLLLGAGRISVGERLLVAHWVIGSIFGEPSELFLVPARASPMLHLRLYCILGILAVSKKSPQKTHTKQNK